MSFYSQKSWFESSSTPVKPPDQEFSQDLFSSQDRDSQQNIEEEVSTFWSQSQHRSSFQHQDIEHHNFEPLTTSEPSQFFRTKRPQPDFQLFRTPAANVSHESSQFLNTQTTGKSHSSLFLMTQQDIQASPKPSQFLQTQQTTVNSQPSQHQNSFQAKEQSELNFLQTSLFVSNDKSLEIDITVISDDEEPSIKSHLGSHSKSQESQAQQSNLSSEGNVETQSESYGDSDVPTSIEELRKTLKDSSDWTIMSIIAGQLCKDSFPMTTYHNLKLSLLLSIASINSKSSPIPIVAVGQEILHANAIMTFVGQFAQRFVTSSLNTFEGSSVSTKDGHIEAGPLLLSKGGVLFIGDWFGLPPKTVSKLLREIETGQVTTEKVQQSVPLECSIWTYWSCSTKVKKDISSINQFMSVFGVPIMIDDFNNEMNIIDDLINQNDNSDGFHIPDDEMRDYLRHVAKQHVTMDPDSPADLMLKNYFTATRIIRQNSLTPKAFEILQQMSESHAKLCLRNTVTCTDVLAAINISEKHIRVLFDKDSYSSPAEPKFASIDDIDVYHKKLHEWLITFTKNILQRQI